MGICWGVRVKICIVTPIFPPGIGGPATYSYEVAKRLQKRGHEIKIIAFADKTPKRLLGIEIFSVGTKFGVFFRQARMFFSALRIAKSCDVIYVQDPAVVGLASTLAGKLLGKPVVVKFVGDIAWETASRDRKTSKFLDEFLRSPEGGFYIRVILNIQKLVLKNVDKVVVPAKYLKNLLMRYYQVSPHKIEVIYNAVNLEDYETLKKHKINDAPVLITIGRLLPWKSVDGIMGAMPALAKKYPQIKLLIVGDGSEMEKLKKLAENLKIGKHVVFLERVKHEHAMELLKGSDLLVLNSTYEGLPHVVIEAMGCKVPVIATNIKGTREVVKHGKTGILVKVGATRELQRGIERLLEDGGLRKKLMANAYGDILDKFTWDRTIKKLERTLGGELS
jgi:glycosyltransferase involved in cell wall biosynthesis